MKKRTIIKKLVLAISIFLLLSSTTFAYKLIKTPSVTVSKLGENNISKVSTSTNQNTVVARYASLNTDALQSTNQVINYNTNTSQSSTPNIQNYFYTWDTAKLSTDDISHCKSVVETVIAIYPSYLISSLNEINLSFDPSNLRGRANSTYLQVRCVNISDSELKAVLVHELSHIIDGGYLTGDASSGNSNYTDLSEPVYNNDPSLEYYEISWKNNTTWASDISSQDFCSSYGSSDPFEDLAECTTHYVLNNKDFLEKSKTNPVLKEKYDFIKEKIFDFKTFNSQSNDLNLTQVYDVTKLAYISDEF